MAWKEIHNAESDSPKTKLSGICKLSGKQAEVCSFFYGVVECKTDLQKTLRFKGYKCSLQEETGFQNLACMDECPLIQKEYL